MEGDDVYAFRASEQNNLERITFGLADDLCLVDVQRATGDTANTAAMADKNPGPCRLVRTGALVISLGKGELRGGMRTLVIRHDGDPVRLNRRGHFDRP